MALSYLGFPSTLKKLLFLLTGIAISGMAFFWGNELRRRRRVLAELYYQHKEGRKSSV